MKIIDTSQNPIFDISWSKDSKWLCYVTGEKEIAMTNCETGEKKIIGKGNCPQLTGRNTVIMERSGEIVEITDTSESVIVSIGDIVKNTPKKNPVLSPDGSLLTLSVHNVFDKESESKNSYPHRHFLAIAKTNGKKKAMTDQQWYGGTVSWFSDNSMFAHFEFDSTAGPRTHVLSSNGDLLNSMAGLYPAVCPDNKKIAVHPRSGGSIVIYQCQDDSWKDDKIITNVIKIPSSETARTSYSFPLWLDNRFLLLEDGEKVFKVDTKREKTFEMSKIPLPVTRRKQSMLLSPDKSILAMEVATDDKFELKILTL